MQTNKIIPALILLVSLVTPFCLGTLWFDGQLSAAKKTAKSILESETENAHILELKFSQDDAARLLDWEHAHEFSYKGEMYDVVRSVDMGDSVLYYCYHDIKESKLQKAFQTFMGGFLQHQPFQNKQHKHTETFFKSLYFSDILEGDVGSFALSKNIASSLYVAMVSDYSGKPASPPPQSGC